MSRSDETLYRQWVMLTRIPRYPRKITVPALKSILLGEGYTVDTRTIQRDLNKLSVPFPLSNDTEGRKNYWYWIEEASIQDLPGMDPVTALAFEMAESYLMPLLPRATLELLQPYFHRARDVLTEQSDSLLRKWPEKVAVIERGPVLQKPEINADVQSVVYQALLEEKSIKASYQPRDAVKSKDYLIHPLGLVSRVGVIYLICTLWDYENIKQFALHRFTHAEMTGNSVNIHQDFSLSNYIEKDQKFSYKLEEKPIQLEVLFDARTATHLNETPLSANQTLSRQVDGRFLLKAEIIDTLELRWWLQGFGDNIEVLSPIAMREKFKATALSLQALYC